MARYLSLSPTILRENENGFVLCSSLLLISTVIASLVFIFFFQSVVRKNSEIKSACLEFNFKFQDKQRRRLEALLSLNPRARRLRQDLEIAKKRYRQALLTGTPQVIAAARAQILLVEMQRLVLDGKQRTLLMQSSFEEKSFRVQIERQLQRHFHSPASLVIQINSLAVEPDRGGEVAPLYQLKSNFMYSQKSQAVWKTTFENYIYSRAFFLKQNLVSLPNRQKWENSCAATIEERQQKFFVSITTVK